MTYDNIASKFFKNRAKKIVLSLNFTATRYSGNVQDQILAPISRKWLHFSQNYPLEIYFRAPKSAFSIVIFLGEYPPRLRSLRPGRVPSRPHERSKKIYPIATDKRGQSSLFKLIISFSPFVYDWFSYLTLIWTWPTAWIEIKYDVQNTIFSSRIAYCADLHITCHRGPAARRQGSASDQPCPISRGSLTRSR